MPRTDLAWALAAVAALLAITQTARIAWTRWARRSAIRARVHRAMDGEARAEPLLRRAGYEVLARQAPGHWTVRADGAPIAIALRADLLVSKGGRRYVAEVKTGRLAPRLDHAPTRRQLLEYQVAFGVDGVLLVDAETDRVIEVEMAGAGTTERASAPAAPRPWWVAFAFGAVAGGALVTWLVR